VEWVLPSVRDNYNANNRRLDTATNIQLMAYLLSQEADAMKPDPVEIFDARKAKISISSQHLLRYLNANFHGLKKRVVTVR
jgi:hypothetical protein